MNWPATDSPHQMAQFCNKEMEECRQQYAGKKEQLKKQLETEKDEFCKIISAMQKQKTEATNKRSEEEQMFMAKLEEMDQQLIQSKDQEKRLLDKLVTIETEKTALLEQLQ